MTLTSDEIWQRLQTQTNRTISLHERVTKLPPAFIRNDRQVTSYLNKLKENGDLHLCVTIKVTA
ncbi:hypothetical protein YC2023_019036 [Brassica napus]